MPTKRGGTRQVSFFLPDEEYQKLQDYIATNYAPSERYGARSEVLTNAVSSYCVSSTDSIPVNYSMEGRKIMTPEEAVIWKYQHQPIGTDNEEEKKDV